MLSDTESRARAILTSRFREFGGDWCLRAALRMSEEFRTVSVSGVRLRHPDWTEKQVQLAVARAYLGQELADRVLGPGA